MSLLTAFGVGAKIFKGITGGLSSKRKIKRAQKKLEKAEARAKKSEDLLSSLGIRGAGINDKPLNEVQEQVFDRMNSITPEDGGEQENRGTFVSQKFRARGMFEKFKELPVLGKIGIVAGALLLVFVVLKKFMRKR